MWNAWRQLYMYLYMCSHICEYVYSYTYILTDKCNFVCVFTLKFTHMYACIHTNVWEPNACVYNLIAACSWWSQIHVFLFVISHLHSHICTHTFTHMYENPMHACILWLLHVSDGACMLCIRIYTTYPTTHLILFNAWCKTCPYIHMMYVSILYEYHVRIYTFIWIGIITWCAKMYP